MTILGLLGYGFQIFAVRSYLAPSRRSLEETSLSEVFPPVSILKPLKGLDDNLFDNLESFCKQDYPAFEIICSLQDHNDPAYRVAWKIKEKHPKKDISILVQRCDKGLNPKINNLLPAQKAAKHPYILISDSNVMVAPDYLKRIVKPMEDPCVGLVSNLIRGVGGKTMGSLFENLHLNSFILGNVCALDKYLNLPCVVGKSMLMRQKDLESIGGLQSFKNVLAEDYLIGETIRKRGQKVVVSDYLINNVNEYWGLRKFINRHTRWAKMRWKIGGMKYFSELLANPVFVSLLPLSIWGPTKRTVSLAVTAAFLKVAGDYYLGRKIKAGLHPFSYLFSPLKDLLIGLIWLAPIASNTVMWRGNRYLIGKDTILSRAPDSLLQIWKSRIQDAMSERMGWVRLASRRVWNYTNSYPIQ
jgi:ceramide glucosyltransferase